MAIPTYQATGTVSESAVAGTSIQPPWPAHQAGDIGLLIVESRDHQGPSGNLHPYLVSDAGFQELFVSPAYAGQVSNYSTQAPRTEDAQSRCLSVYWCRATSSSMPAPTFNNKGNHKRGRIITFRGCAPAGNPIHAAADKRYDMTSGTAKTFPAVTTTDNDCLIVNILGTGDGGNYSGWTNASLSALTEIFDGGNASLGSGSFMGAACGGLAAAGSSGATAVTVDINDYAAMITLALTPTEPAADKYPYVANLGDIIRSSTGNITVPWPPHKTGDIGILVVSSRAFPVPALATAAGFTEISGTRQAAGPSGSGSSLVAFICTATSNAMSSPVVAWAGTGIAGMIFTVRNSGGLDVAASGKDAGSGTAITIPGVTTSKPTSLVALICSSARNNGDAVMNNDWANANFASLKPAVIDSDGGAIPAGIHLGKGKMAAAGATGNTTLSCWNSTRWAAMALAFKPASTALIAEKGGFIYSGKDARLLRQLRLVAGKGSFAYSGKASSLTAVFHHYTLRAEKGHFAFGFKDVNLEHNIGGGWSREVAGPSTAWTKQDPLED